MQHTFIKASKKFHHVFFPALAPVPQAPGPISTPKCNHSCTFCSCCYTVDSLAAVVGVCVHHCLSIPSPHLAATSDMSQHYTIILTSIGYSMGRYAVCRAAATYSRACSHLKHAWLSFLLRIGDWYDRYSNGNPKDFAVRRGWCMAEPQIG